MRKINYTLALAALACASVYAAPVKTQAVKGSATAQELAPVEFVSVNGPEKSAPNKAATVNDFLGYFACEYTWPFSSSDPGTSVNITLVEGNTVAMTFSPWHIYSNVFMDPVVATVNVNAGTITINTAANANLGYAEFSDGTENIGWRAQKLVSDGAGGTNREDLTEVVGTLQADGSITFGGINEICGFGVIGTNSWLGAFRDLKLVAPNYFKYEADEWESAGQASYKEYILNPLLTNTIPAVQVPLEKSTTEEGLYLLRRPYAYGDWTQVNENPSSEGYIVFSVGTPECVWVRPLTPSGLWVDLGSEAQPDIEEFYIYNLEGDYVFNEDADPEEIAEVFEEEGTPLSTYNEATKTANIVNVYFGDTENPGASYTWTQFKNLTMTITLPSAGVDGILNDAENGAVRYFNLQGLEIANPAAGELVIVKEGNKTSKTIVR